MPSINAAGLAIIKEFEGDALHAYLDAGGVPTIGYGHAEGVTMGESITEAQALAFLEQDVKGAESAVAALVEIDLTPNQFSALVSFTYNVGEGAFGASTMLRLINSNDLDGAAKQFDYWIYDDGVILQGLVRRRAAEKALFLTPG